MHARCAVPILIAALGMSAAPALASSEVGHDRRIGAGIVVGDPNGLSGKIYLGGPLHAVDLAVAWDTWGWGGIYSHATYLIHPSVLHSENGVDIRWNVGVGGMLISGRSRFAYQSTMGIGARAPIGLDFDLWDIPLQIFCSLSAEILIVPSTNVGLGLGLGVRYYF